MNRKIINALVITLMFASLLIPVYNVEGQSFHSPSFIHVLTDTSYVSGAGMSTFWVQSILFHVTDEDGLDNLFYEGNVQFEIKAPDQETYPKTGDEVTVSVESSSNPPSVHIAWHNTLANPPELGSYTITITDANGLSATYDTQPTVRVSTTVPTIIYPEGFSVIIETDPTIKWKSYSRLTSAYRVEVWRPEAYWGVGIPVIHARIQMYEYKYDGPGLVQGESYTLFLFASEDEVVGEVGKGGVEIRRVTSIASTQFTIYNPQVLKEALETLKLEVINLEASDCKFNRRNPDYWIRFRDEITSKLDSVIGLLDDPTPTLGNYATILQNMGLVKGYLSRILDVGNVAPRFHPLIEQANMIRTLLTNVIKTY